MEQVAVVAGDEPVRLLRDGCRFHRICAGN